MVSGFVLGLFLGSWRGLGLWRLGVLGVILGMQVLLISACLILVENHLFECLGVLFDLSDLVDSHLIFAFGSPFPITSMRVLGPFHKGQVLPS